MRALQIVVLLLAPALASSGFAQPALLTNARVQVLASTGNLAREMDARVAAQAEAGWIGYAVPARSGDHFVCDWRTSTPKPTPTAVKLEGPDTVYVLFRAERRTLTKVRLFSEGCAIDAGGLPVIWLTGVPDAQSVAMLSRVASTAQDRRLGDGALAALAMHREAGAAVALLAMARSGATAYLRGQALFWIAQRAGDLAIPAITDALDRDPETEVKKKAVFALSQLPDAQGVPKLIDVARSHSNPAVRKQAMFWLGQSRDPRALAFFEAILFK